MVTLTDPNKGYCQTVARELDMITGLKQEEGDGQVLAGDCQLQRYLERQQENLLHGWHWLSLIDAYVIFKGEVREMISVDGVWELS